MTLDGDTDRKRLGQGRRGEESLTALSLVFKEPEGFVEMSNGRGNANLGEPIPELSMREMVADSNGWRRVVFYWFLKQTN